MTIIRASEASPGQFLAFDASGDLEGVDPPSGTGIDASTFSDLNDSVINNTTTLDGWTANDIADGGVFSVVNGNEIRVKSYFDHSPNPANPTPMKVYLDFPAPLDVGNYVEVAFEFMYDTVTGMNRAFGTYLKAVAASGAGMTGTTSDATDLDLQVPQPFAWYTIRIPLNGITSLRSIGITEVETSTNTSVRGWLNFRNIRFREATGIDQAVYGSGPNAHITIPADYTSTKTQLPIFREPAGVSWVDQRAGGRQRRSTQTWHADDFLLDHTGTLDVSAEMQWIVNEVMEPGDTFEFRRDGHYKMDTAVLFVGLRDLSFVGNNATVFSTAERNTAFFYAYDGYRNLTFQGLNIVGYSVWEQNGSVLVTVAGTPTTSGTTKLLDAQNEEAKVPTIGGQSFDYYYGRDKDGLCRWEFLMSDTAQVANDCVIQVKNTAGTVLQTSTFTLTGTPATYEVTYRPTALEERYVVTVKKATATANTITVASFNVYRVGLHFSSIELNSGFRADDGTGFTVQDCRVESVSGDAFQNSAELATDVTITNLYSRCCGRQGFSFNYARSVRIDGLTIVGAGRSGVDIEPYTNNWFVEDAVVSNVRIVGPVINGISQINWGRIDRVHWDNVELVDCGSGRALSGGANHGSFTNMRHYRIERVESSGNAGTIVPDFSFNGRNLLIDGITADRGIYFLSTPSVDTSGNSLAAGGHTLGNWRVDRPGTYGALTVDAGVNVHVTGGPGEVYDLVPVGGRGTLQYGAIGPAANVRNASGLNFGLHNHRLPKSYRGTVHTSMWMPGGYDMVDEPLHRVAGFGGSNTAVTLLASGARTTTGTSTGVDVGAATVVRLRLHVSALSGTSPTLAVTIQQSWDNTNWFSVDSFRTLALGAAADWSEVLEVRNTARYLRVSYTIAGTSPSFTFSVIGDASVAANNLSKVDVAVTTGATSLAVTFPSRSFPDFDNYTVTGATGGSLTPSTSYYYRVVARPVPGGPIVPTIAEKTAALSAVQNAVTINPLGFEDVPTGTHIAGVTIYRGTASGVYDTRYDVLPFTRLFTLPRDVQTFVDLGSTLTVPVVTNISTPWTVGYPPVVQARTGSFTPVDETGWELDANYMVHVETSWATTVSVTGKTRSGLTINFGTAAPAGAKASWFLLR